MVIVNSVPYLCSREFPLDLATASLPCVVMGPGTVKLSGGNGTRSDVMGGRADFGQAIKKLREAAGMTQKELGAALGYATDSIRHYEGGRRTPPPELGPKLDHYFKLPAPVMNLMCEQAQKDMTTFGELKEHEQRARRIRIWENRFVPGLLQTEAYAKALLKYDDLVRERLDRQRVLAPERGLSLRVVIEESVLYRTTPNSADFAAQLSFLIRPDASWTLQVMPVGSGIVHPGWNGSLHVLEFDNEAPVAYVESSTSGTLIDTAERVGRLRNDFDEIQGLALSPQLSAEMIAVVIADISED
jgi:transcriptional regulator with XRE-family HTH domain